MEQLDEREEDIFSFTFDRLCLYLPRVVVPVTAYSAHMGVNDGGYRLKQLEQTFPLDCTQPIQSQEVTYITGKYTVNIADPSLLNQCKSTIQTS
ncbi:hypothetical protein J6590_077228 [Homalodisca vitripennis]|nr:hypothetical protein J6590_086722 [Homalodisca vitripennis]KAG8315115.1 hypothetical protein J6590_077228 [Homalodisca vitripennis]